MAAFWLASRLGGGRAMLMRMVQQRGKCAALVRRAWMQNIQTD